MWRIFGTEGGKDSGDWWSANRERRNTEHFRACLRQFAFLWCHIQLCLARVVPFSHAHHRCLYLRSSCFMNCTFSCPMLCCFLRCFIGFLSKFSSCVQFLFVFCLSAKGGLCEHRTRESVIGRIKGEESHWRCISKNREMKSPARVWHQICCVAGCILTLQRVLFCHLTILSEGKFRPLF